MEARASGAAAELDETKAGKYQGQKEVVCPRLKHN